MNHSVYQKVSIFEEVFLHEKGISRFRVKNLLFHMTEKLRKGSFLFHKTSDIGEIMDITGGSEFPWKFFCLTLPKTSVGEPFCVVFQKISDSLKILWKKWEGGV